MAVSGMNHFTILTDDVPRPIAFYGDLLGLTRTARAVSRFPARGCTRARPRSCTSSAARRATSCGPASSTTWRSRRPDSRRRLRSSRRTTRATTAGSSRATARGRCSSSTRTARAWSSTSRRHRRIRSSDDAPRVEPDHLVVRRGRSRRAATGSSSTLGVRPQPGGSTSRWARTTRCCAWVRASISK